MFTCLILLLSICIYSAQPHLQRVGTNLLANPDVNGSTNWTISSGTYDASVSRDNGTGSFKMTTVYPALGFSTIQSQLIPVIPGKTYTLSFYMRSEVFPASVPNIYVAYYDSNQNYLHGTDGTRQGLSCSGAWQECSVKFRPESGDVYVKVVNLLMHSMIGYNGPVWIDNFYMGEGIGFEQAPSAKNPFSGAQTKIDALGNVEIFKNGLWNPFFPIGIYTDAYRNDWGIYSVQGFNTNMWAGTYWHVQKAKNASSMFNPDGMMSGMEIGSYCISGSANYNNLTLLESRIEEIKNNNLMDYLLWYYFDNEAFSEWDVPVAVTNKVKELDVDTSNNRLHPIYALQGMEGLARKYNDLFDVCGDYVTSPEPQSYPEQYRSAWGITTLWNIEQQKSPPVIALINHGVGLKFRARVFTAIAKGAKGIAFWMDDSLERGYAIPVEDQPWWNDLPNIRNEIDQLLPIIRMPHWTSWSLSSNNNLIDFGTRDYQDKAYIIVTNEQSSTQSVTFIISGLSYVAKGIKNFFTHEIESQIINNQFTISIPAYGSKVYILENNIEEMLILKVLCNESSSQTIYDDSWFANDGTLTGNASIGGGTLTLDGFGDYVNCSNDSSLDLGTQDITISGRIKLDTIQSAYNGIVSKGASGPADPGYAFFYRESNGGMLTLALSDGTANFWVSSNINLNLNDNQWHIVSVSAVRNGNAIFYVDGISVGGGSISSVANSNIVNLNKDLQIGSWLAYWDMKGQVDNVMIYKHALTQTEIIDAHGRKLEMQFNENSGQTVYDDSCFDNDGILTANAFLGGGVLSIDGAGDYVNCGNDSSLELGTQDMTITARVKLDTTQSTYSGIVSKGAGGPADTGYAFFYRESNGGMLTLSLSDGTTNFWASSNINLNLNDNQWHTVSVSVSRNDSAVFYVDGVSVGSGTVSSFVNSDITNSNNDLQIGSWLAYWDMKGQIDNVKIYNRALTAQEILMM